MNGSGRPLNVGRIISGQYEVIEALGEGGASEVYKVRQIGLNVDRALKILRQPENSTINSGFYIETFKKEIRLLSALSHRNLTKILDLGDLEIDGEKRSYYVMEFANGKDLRANSGFNSIKEALKCFGQVLDVLEYLHDRNILHFDIKPENLLIHTDQFSKDTEYKVVDLGVSKIVNLDSGTLVTRWTKGRNETYVFGTKKYAPPYAQGQLNKTNLPFNRSEIQRWLPHYDLYALGLTMAEMLLAGEPNSYLDRQEVRTLFETNRTQGPALRQLNEDQLRYLTEYILLLLEPNLENFAFKSTREAREAFERMDPRRSLPLLVPEITSVGSRYLINKSNLTSRLSERAFEIVSHPCFHRLQRLNQLNLVELIYPDARQSRLSHSIETFELAKEVACHLLGDELFRLNVRGQDLGLFLCAALLHDIGHYPLAHAVEDLRLEVDDPESRPKADIDTAEYFLTLPPQGDIPPISKVLWDEWGIDVNELLKVIGRSTEGLPIASSFFRQLLDGAIDIDKLAYLSKDSLFTGAAYGKGIDIQALISSLTVLKPKKNEGVPQIGLLDKGVRAAESMIIARYHMFSRVYWHHTNRAAMAMIRYVMKRVFQHKPKTGRRFSFGTYLEETMYMSDMEALKLLSDNFNSIQEGKGRNAVPNPVSGILNNSRSIYKRLCSFTNHPKDSSIQSCYNFLNERETTKQTLEKIRQESIKIIGRLIGEKVADSYVLLDVPRIDKKRDFNPAILVKDSRAGKDPVQLTDVSTVVKAISADFEGQVKKSRIFIHPAIREKLRSRSSEADAAAAVEGMIFELSKDHA